MRAIRAKASKTYPQGNVTQIDFLNLPSATTVVFLLMIVTTLHFVTPYTFSQSFVMLISLVLITFKLFLSSPDHSIKKKTMRPLEEIDMELTKQAKDKAVEIGISPPPTFLYTDDPNTQMEAFGTFRHHYVVVNRKIWQANERSDVLGAIYHELGHLRSGDNWKFRLAEQIVFAFQVFTVAFMLPAVVTTDYGWERLVIGSPFSQAELVVTLLAMFITLYVMRYLLRVMRIIREYYADAWMNYILNDQGQLFKAFGLVSETNQNEQTGYIKTLFSRLWLGRPLWSTTKEAQERAYTLTTGNTYRVMYLTILAGGLTVGTQVFALSGGGLSWLFWLFYIGGLFVSVLYLLPHTLQVQKRAAILIAIKSVGIFTSGVIGFLIFRAFAGLATNLIAGVYMPLVVEDLEQNLLLGGFILLGACVLAIALVSTIMIVRPQNPVIFRGIERKLWNATALLIFLAQAVGVLMVLLLAALVVAATAVPTIGENFTFRWEFLAFLTLYAVFNLLVFKAGSFKGDK